MISDILSQAVADLDHYLNNPNFDGTYNGELRARIIQFRDEAECLRAVNELRELCPSMEVWVEILAEELRHTSDYLDAFASGLLSGGKPGDRDLSNLCFAAFEALRSVTVYADEYRARKSAPNTSRSSPQFGPFRAPPANPEVKHGAAGSEFEPR